MCHRTTLHANRRAGLSTVTSPRAVVADGWRRGVFMMQGLTWRAGACACRAPLALQTVAGHMSQRRHQQYYCGICKMRTYAQGCGRARVTAPRCARGRRVCTAMRTDNVLAPHRDGTRVRAPIEIRVARTARRCVIRRRLRERLLARRRNSMRSYCCVCDFCPTVVLMGSHAAAVELVEK